LRDSKDYGTTRLYKMFSEKRRDVNRLKTMIKELVSTGTIERLYQVVGAATDQYLQRSIQMLPNRCTWHQNYATNTEEFLFLSSIIFTQPKSEFYGYWNFYAFLIISSVKYWKKNKS